MKVKEYVDDYIKYYPEKWSWVLKCNNNFCQNELYLKTRARRCKRYDGTNYDLLPDFSSIERDAAQFGLNHVEWTDFVLILFLEIRSAVVSALLQRAALIRQNIHILQMESVG